MIRCIKSAGVPSSLARGVAATAADCASFEADPGSFRSGIRTFTIRKSIYGTSVVKRRLKSDQHDKCAFCEGLFDANVAGDVEHFRPKSAISGDTGMLYPGYYWLGYAWENLSYACPDCNSYRKGCRFPLADETVRARGHLDDLGAEDPLLLDPYGADDPRRHIRFVGEAPKGRTPQGETTIEVLDLKRTKLARDRLTHLRGLSDLYKSAQLLEKEGDDEAAAHAVHLRGRLAAAVQPQAKFSAAAADHIAALDAGLDLLPPEVLPALAGHPGRDARVPRRRA